jgi:polysaccharide biosynthesis/export protein
MLNSFIFLIIIVFSFGQSQADIEKIKKTALNSGMSKSQMISAAKLKGYSNKEIKSVIEKVENQNSRIDNADIKKTLSSERKPDFKDEPAVNNKKILNPNLSNDTQVSPKKTEKINENLEEKKLEYFGYDIFKQDPAIFQASSVGAVDPQYLIGPGDEIILTIWGETQFRQVLTVDKEGFIFIPEIGQVFVNGLTLVLMEAKLYKVLSKSYASLDPSVGTPTTFLDISIGNLRPLRIQVLGEVSQPGSYIVSPSTSLFSSLYYFKGPTTLGSLRNINLLRNGKLISNIDFYDFLLTGKKPNDQKLQLDDVIFVPQRVKTVAIKGEVHREGIYELKKNEGFKDLLEVCGGLKASAYSQRAQVDRVVPFERRVENGPERIIIDVDLDKIRSKKSSFTLFDGDEIIIFAIKSNRDNYVNIKGPVKRPGRYELLSSLNLKDLIIKADSLEGYAYLDRVDIIRKQKDFTEELIKLNLKKVMADDKNHNINLKNKDVIKIYNINDLFPQKFVNIRGNVKNPGRFKLLKNMNIYDLIFMSGGILNYSVNDKTLLLRADLIRLNDDQVTKKIIPFNLGQILEDKSNPQNLELVGGDILNIYSKEILSNIFPVFINGSIQKEGRYNLKNNMTVKDIIFEAGGFTGDYFFYNIEIARADPSRINEDEYVEIFEYKISNKFDIQNKTKFFNLMPYDNIFIRPEPYVGLQKKVEISGLVKYPGSYSIVGPNETISDLILRSGGLKPDAFLEGSRFVRDENILNIDLQKILKNPNSNNNIKVQDGDQIIIASNPNTVEILGAVNAPGFYVFNKKFKIKSLIKQAGGFSQNVNKNDIFIIYPNGRSKKYSKWLRNPKILDGSIISVGFLPETKPFNKTEYFKELTSVIANLLQVISILVIASK